jgi:hypothetical protein
MQPLSQPGGFPLDVDRKVGQFCRVFLALLPIFYVCKVMEKYTHFVFASKVLPICFADPELLHEINGFGRCAGLFGFVVCPKGPEKVKVSFGFCD